MTKRDEEKNGGAKREVEHQIQVMRVRKPCC